MIDRIPLSRKLLAMVLIPVVGWLIAVTSGLHEKYLEYRTMTAVSANARASSAIGALDRELVVEGALTYVALSDPGDSRWAAALDAQRVATDKSVASFVDATKENATAAGAFGDHLRASQDALGDLAAVRSAVQTRAITADAATERIDKIGGELGDAIGAAANGGEIGRNQRLTAVFLLDHVLRSAGREQALVQTILAKGTAEPELLREAARADEARTRYADAVAVLGDAQDEKGFVEASGGWSGARATLDGLTSAPPGESLTIDGSRWWDDGLHTIDQVRGVQSAIVEDARTATIVDLSSRTIPISEIVQSVGAIAEQSNLLAVNASIEAAKAGEFGRGFSVVASEVKALAQQSKEATDRIRQILAEIQKSSNAAVMITEQGVKRVEEGAELIQQMGRGVEELATVIAHGADGASQILLTAREQVVGVEEIAQAMQSVEQATAENAAGAHELEAAATTVREVATQLRDVVHGRAA